MITLPTVSSGYSELYYPSVVRSRRSWSGNGAGVIEIGWSAERVFRRSIPYSVYGVVSLMYGTLSHVGCIVRLVFIAVHYPLACNKQVG